MLLIFFTKSSGESKYSAEPHSTRSTPTASSTLNTIHKHNIEPNERREEEEEEEGAKEAQEETEDEEEGEDRVIIDEREVGRVEEQVACCAALEDGRSVGCRVIRADEAGRWGQMESLSRVADNRTDTQQQLITRHC